MQLIQLSSFQALRRSILMVIQSAPKELRFLILLTFIGGAAPSLVLFLSKVVIDEVSQLFPEGVRGSGVEIILSHPLLMSSMVGVLLLNFLTDSLNEINNFVLTGLRDRVKGFVQGKVLQKIATFDDIALFETPELLNIVQLSEGGIRRLQQMAVLLVITINGVFTFIPAVLLSASIAWWVPLVMFITAAPSIYVESHYQQRLWDVESSQATAARYQNLYAKMLTGEEYAKEIRIYKLQSLLFNRWRDYFQQNFNQMQQVRKRGILVISAWSILSGLGAGLPYIYVILGALVGRYTLGDLALYAGLIIQVRQSLYGLIGNTSDVYDIALGASPVFQLLELQPQLKSGTASLNTTGTGIEIRNLSFAYPGSDRLTLTNINFNINLGETIALVGENGAGKTTLAKLLCRLYDPTVGEIVWNGNDLRSLNLPQLHSRIGVVMQDYAHFPTTVRENVGFGDLNKLENEVEIKKAIAEVGLTEIIEELSQKLETPLGKQLENGVDLSGGQWQRIAISRALIRSENVELLVFDEPTAALDPKDEHEIYNIFQQVSQGKMTLVVSHRLALAKLCDRIIVLENGKIIENGTHNELMALNRQYHLMFTRQASSYQ